MFFLAGCVRRCCSIVSRGSNKGQGVLMLFGRRGALGALYALLYVCKGKGAFVAGALVAIVFLQLYEGL